MIKSLENNAHTLATCAPKRREQTITNDEILVCMVSEIGKVKQALTGIKERCTTSEEQYTT